MKNILLISLTLFFGFSLFAQKKLPTIASNLAKQSRLAKIIKPDDQQAAFNNPTLENSVLSISNNQIGTTEYDLQTNKSVQNRIVKHADGTISTAWTMGFGAFTDRGTGYNYFDGSAWQAFPSERIESIKTGWPSMTVANGNEVVISHNFGTSLMLTTRTKGTGTWTSAAIPFTSTNALSWPRAMGKGLGFGTIHLIATKYVSSVVGGMLYSRSSDGGATWDIQDIVLPGTDPVTELLPSGADSYNMDVKGDTVGIVTGGMTSDVVLIKSYDGGNTWASQIVWQHQIPLWNTSIVGAAGSSDANGDGLADTLTTTDGRYAVVIGNDGVFHVFMGITKILRDSTTQADYFSFWPYTDGLAYWNSTQSAISPDYYFYADTLLPLIGYMVDVNGNDTIDFNTPVDPATQYPFGDFSFTSLSSWPSAAIGADGDVYCIYSSLVENTDYGDDAHRGFRNIYAVKSTDNGATWSHPKNITQDSWKECLFGSLNRNVDCDLYMVYQNSDEPGIFIQPATANPHVQQTTRINFVDISNDLDFNSPYTPFITQSLNGDTLTSDAASGNQWYMNDTIIPGATNQTYIITTGGIYYDIVTYTECNIDTSNSISSNAGIEEFSNYCSVTIYPNPFHGATNVYVNLSKQSDLTLTVYNLFGQKVYELNKGLVNSGSRTYSIDGSELTSGIYFYTVKAGDYSVTNKMIVQ